MFGKGSKGGNAAFVMKMGRAAGNIKTAKAAPPATKSITPATAVTGIGKGRSLKAPPVEKQPMKGKTMPSAGGALTEGLHISQYGKMSLGKVNTFKTRGK